MLNLHGLSQTNRPNCSGGAVCLATMTKAPQVVARPVAWQVVFWWICKRTCWTGCAMPPQVEPPSFDALLSDLKQLRRHGLLQLRQLELPAMAQSVRALDLVDLDRDVTAPAIEELIRSAVVELGESRIGLTARVLLGLTEGDRDREPAQLRRLASAEWGVSLEHFRRQPETQVLSQVAEIVLAQIQRRAMHLTHLEMARRLPTDSRLAVNWLERFKAYYFIWSAVSGLGADITAYRSTLLEEDRPWDAPPSEAWPEGFTQEMYAANYGRSALLHYTSFLVKLRQFMARHGGQWLLSDGQAEQDLADAVYRIGWHANEMTQRDDSYLRDLYRQANGELNAFLHLLADDKPTGMLIHDEWQEWLDGCQCTWDPEQSGHDREHFPTSRTHPGIQADCHPHSMVRACTDYMLLVDEDWRRVADWYGLEERVRPGVGGEELWNIHQPQKD
jgi:hypothetical protein